MAGKPRHGARLKRSRPVAGGWRQPALLAAAAAAAVAALLLARRPAADAEFPQLALIEPSAGDGGQPVALSAAEQHRAELLHRQHGFNVVASDKVPYVRRLPDVRPATCRELRYDAQLPNASVIINFHNEVWSALLRTVHSVLARTPARLLHEILLVDDASTKDELGAQLERYLAARLPDKVRLLRLPERHGLIKGRHWGASRATGEVLIFLDSHVEPCELWAEPLLQRIKEEPRALVCPAIDNIRDSDLAYQRAERVAGGFAWSGHFEWIAAGDADGRKPASQAAPVRSPVMSGGLYAMNREYFWHLGGYDTGMDVYGGENLELSFRTWQCGGVVETLPCSRVGHIFRDFHPYSFPWSKNPLAANMARIAAVWMDEYSRYFYLHYRHIELPPAGDVSARRELRRRLGCRPFRWYLDTVYPNKLRLDEDVTASGQLRSRGRPDLCLDTLVIQPDVYLGLNTCTEPPVSGQYITYSRRQEVRREDLCAAVSAGTTEEASYAPMLACKVQTPEAHRWTYDPQTEQFRHRVSGLCLDAEDVEAMHLLAVASCSDSPLQKFTFVNSEL